MVYFKIQWLESFLFLISGNDFQTLMADTAISRPQVQKCRRHENVRTAILCSMVRKINSALSRVPLSWPFPCLCLAAKIWPRSQRALSSQSCSHRNSLQNGAVDKFTALIGTTFVTISNHASHATFRQLVGNFRATFGQPSGNLRATSHSVS